MSSGALNKQFIVMVGPAGSGKTTLTASFGKWLEENQGYSVGYVNLDPGVEELPYRPDVDARRYVRVRDVMEKLRLGPNGALIVSVDMLLKHAPELVSEISSLPHDFVIVDTPGQMELFLFRETGPAFISKFKELGQVAVVLIFDPTLTNRLVDAVALRLMNLVAQLRLASESTVIINKCDLLGEGSEDLLSPDLTALMEKLKGETGVLADMAVKLLEVISGFGLASRVVKVSAVTGEGLQELYDLLHEVYCTCGDLT